LSWLTIDNEHDVLTLLERGDEAAFETLYKAANAPVYNFSLSLAFHRIPIVFMVL